MGYWPYPPESVAKWFKAKQVVYAQLIIDYFQST